MMKAKTGLVLVAVLTAAWLLFQIWKPLEAVTTPLGIRTTEISDLNVPPGASRLLTEASRSRFDLEQAEAPAPLASGALLELFLEVAAAEETIAMSPGQAWGSGDAAVVKLESAIGQIMGSDQNLGLVLGHLSARPGAENQLDQRTTYGAIRSIYWWIVVAASKADARPIVLDVLASLPDIHPGAVNDLIENLILAAADGVLVLDASYLEDILYLRSLFPEKQQLFSQLFELIGETLSAEERDAFFSVFLNDLDDPVLVGLTIRNLLLGTNPDFALFLAKQRVDDPTVSAAVRKAVAAAVAANSDVFSATEFLAERTQLFRNSTSLWMEVGSRDGGQVALDTEYKNLVLKNANPRARMMLVTGMRTASFDDLVRIADTDPEGMVVGQALMTATSRSKDWSGVEAEQLFGIVQKRYGLDPLAGGIDTAQAMGAAANIARYCKQAGNPALQAKAVAVLRAIAEDPTRHSSYRQSALDSLEPYLNTYEMAALQAALAAQ